MNPPNMDKSDLTTPLTGTQAALLGALGFGAVSVVVYGTVAFAGKWLYRNLTEAGAYGFWAALYLLGTPWLLGRLLVPSAKRQRYGWVFVLGFLAYAAGWVAPYFALRGKPGELVAALVGPVMLAVVMALAFRRSWTIPATAAVLVVGHGLGYFAGDVLNSTLKGPLGMVMWGVCHGLGYGAAIGWATRMWTADSVGADGTADVRLSGGG
jgi:hypothetical protein